MTWVVAQSTAWRLKRAVAVIVHAQQSESNHTRAATVTGQAHAFCKHPSASCGHSQRHMVAIQHTFSPPTPSIHPNLRDAAHLTAPHVKPVLPDGWRLRCAAATPCFRQQTAHSLSVPLVAQKIAWRLSFTKLCLRGCGVGQRFGGFASGLLTWWRNSWLHSPCYCTLNNVWSVALGKAVITFSSSIDLN
jgi:hypothetical protein